MATTTGYIDYTEQGSAPSTPSTGHWRVFTKSDGLYIVDDAGAVTGPFVSNASAAVPAAHGCRVHRASGNVALGNNTFTVITWDAEDHDTDSMHDNSSNPSRIVIPSISGVTTGLWSMYSHGYSSATSGRTDIQFRANANGSNAGGTLIATIVGPAIASSGVGPVQGSAQWVLSAGDYVEVFYRTVSGSFNLLFDSAVLPTFSVAFLGKVS